MIAIIIGLILGGTIGYHLIEGWSLIESFYMTIITITTVGFGEVRTPSNPGRIFTVILILCGVAIITTGVTSIFSSIIAGTFGEVIRRRKMERNLLKIKNHFIICGLGVVGEDVINEFLKAKASFVIIEKEKAVLDKLLNEFPSSMYIIGDATDDEVLKNARIEAAKGIIVVLGNDADNLYICLTARSLNPKLRIIARAIEGEAINKLKKAGADYVFSPEKIGGVQLASAALRPSVTSFLDAVLRGEYLNLIFDEIEVQTGSAVAGKMLKETNISKDIGIIIPAIKSAESDKLTLNPSSDTVLNQGDVLIAFGSNEQINRLKKFCGY